VLFALAVGAMFYRLWRDDSPAAAVAAVAAILLLPRLFAHAHFASFDGPLTSCWILAWASFSPALRSRRWAVLWGIALGLTMSTKATGWLAPLPFLAWTLLYRDRAGLRAFGLGVVVALATFFLVNPPLWHHPVGSWLTFFDLNLHRGNHGWNISTQFLGRMYDLDHPLPWYNTLFWTAITVPLGILVLSVFGLGHTVRRWRDERGAMLVLANWLTLMIVRALPMAPPHDGIRLFLPAFAFLAILAGIGTARLLAILSSRLAWPTAARRTAMGAIVLAYLGSATSLFWYAPQWLSYYNLLIGGLPGATAVGMEPTYYWDALDGEVLEWLHGHTAPGEKIRFGAGPADNLRLMRGWKVLQRDYLPAAPGDYRWYVLQRRPSAWQAEDRWLLEHEQPAFQKTLRPGGWGPWRLEAPLLEVYSYDQYLRAKQNSSPAKTP
jgi:4-amino-4-deoxy-L-arabinose transferase-like glycosyltransferase